MTYYCLKDLHVSRGSIGTGAQFMYTVYIVITYRLIIYEVRERGCLTEVLVMSARFHVSLRETRPTDVSPSVKNTIQKCL